MNIPTDWLPSTRPGLTPDDRGKSAPQRSTATDLRGEGQVVASRSDAPLREVLETEVRMEDGLRQKTPGRPGLLDMPEVPARAESEVRRGH
jgi:hypothetical protein